jgi:ribosomal protein S27AE
VSVRSRRAQAGLPGLAPLCPHCGETDATIMVEDSDTTGELICAERWECRQCGGVFWSLPTLALDRISR